MRGPQERQVKLADTLHFRLEAREGGVDSDAVLAVLLSVRPLEFTWLHMKKIMNVI